MVRYWPDMRVETQPVARDAAGHLGQEQRHLIEFRERQRTGEVRQVPVDDAAPDTDGIEFGIPLRTGSPLLLQDPEVEVPDMVAGLAGLQVRFRLQDWPHAFCNGPS